MLLQILLPIGTLILGLLAGYFVANKLKDKEINLMKNSSETEKTNLEQLGEKFKSIASDVLQQNSDYFTKNAKKDFDSTKEIIKTTLEEKGKGFETIAKGVNDIVKNLEQKVTDMESKRSEQFTSLGEGIKSVLEAEGKIGDSVNNLKTALASGNAIRGKWGEAFLKNVLDECGMQEGTDYVIQKTLQSEDGALRPDVIVNLPGNTKLAIDSKANMTAYFAALEEKDDSKKAEHIKAFVAHIKDTIQKLSSKEYQKYLDDKIPYVIMFIPSESAIRVAFQTSANLFAEAQQKKVILASPSTIMPLLLLIAHSWKQHKASENAYRVTGEVIELGKRLQTFFNHILSMNKGIEQVNEKFNEAVGSWDRSVVPKLTSLNEMALDIQSKGELKPIEGVLRLPEKKIK
jgi:DNA recombination protein RmuC